MKTRNITILTLLITALIGFCAMNAQKVGAVQEQTCQTLELVRTYQSEEEVQAAYPDLFPQSAITDEGDYIKFSDPGTRRLLKKIEKKKPVVVREERKEGYTIVWERSYNYQIFENQPLMLVTEWEGGRLEPETASPPELRRKPQKRILYNAKGEEITQLPLEVSTIILSPDQQHFLAVGFGEEPSPYFYYAIDGTLLKTIDFNEYDNVSFSQGGKFLQMSSSSEKRFAVISKTGEPLYAGDYTTLLNDRNIILYSIFASDDGASFLLSTPINIYLFSMTGDLLWEAPSSGVLKVYFNSDKRILQLITVCERLAQPGKDDDRQLEIRNLDSGQLLEKVEGVSIQTRFTKDVTIIHKGGKYYEYHIKK